MKFQRNLREEVSINLTPLIDVVFLLLIFFMITTTFSRETSLQINLPEASGEPVEAPPAQMEILVTEDGRFAVNGKLLSDATPRTLTQALLEAAGDNTAIPLVITADARALHQSVVTAMDAVAQAGFSQLHIATRPTDTD